MRIIPDVFYNGMPNHKTLNRLMADNGYVSPSNLQPDTSNYHPIGDMTDHIPGPGWGTGPNVNPSQYRNDYPGLGQGSSANVQVAPPTNYGMDLQFNSTRPPANTVNNPNGFGQYFNTGLGLADSLIPGERIHKNYVTQPLPTYNPYQYGTGSQAIMEQGGFFGQEGHLNVQHIQPRGFQFPWADDGIMLESFDKDEAKNGHWLQGAVNPAHKGYCTPMTKSTCTPRRKAFAKTMKKHHGFHKGEDGIILEPYDKITAEEGIMLESYDKITAANGGQLSSDKAKEMLRDGTAQGHELTKKQKRYFGYVAGGGKPMAPNGTQLPIGGSQPNEQYTPRNRTDAYLVDDINNVLTSRTRTKNTGYAPEQQQLLTDAYIWSQKNPNISGRDSIQGYFNQAVDTNNPLQMQRARLSKIGGDPLSMYNTTPNLDVQAPKVPPVSQPVASTMASGGYVPGSVHDLSEEDIAKLLKSGHRIEYL